MDRFIDKIKAKSHHIVDKVFNEIHEGSQATLTQMHRFDSFAPVRHGAHAKFFIDGHDYCWAVSEAIEKAQHAVYIEDWWLTPELYLRRPPADHPEYRIDALLKRKAEQGVKIYIVVYKEVPVAMTLDSRHTKTSLHELHQNIVVQRHPDHDLSGTFFWSHHEKFVVVDNHIAFLGGIDLCFGRWDTHSHPLADYQGPEAGMTMFPGQDYSDARVRDFAYVQDWSMHLIDKTAVPRMPWHDVSMCVIGNPVLDIARHFCERWNFIKNKKGLKKICVPFLEAPVIHQSITQPLREIGQQIHHHLGHNEGQVQGTCRAQVLRSVGHWSIGLPTEHSIQNAYIEAIYKAKYYVYIENQFFITSTENDPLYVLKNRIGEAIVRRIIRAHEEGDKFKVIVLMPLMPAFPADLSTKDGAVARLIMNYQYMSICRGNKSILAKLRNANIEPNDYIRFYSLRSYDRIHRRKLEEMLARAAGYSAEYVGQQVESLQVTGGRSYTLSEEVYNADACIASDSIAKYAMKNGGNLEEEPWLNDTAHSQSRDEAAEKVERDGYVSEEAYIHAKLLIADDRVVIMGSANLNDRSQCGDRDSEIAIYVEDQDLIPSRMNGRHYEAGRFAATLRRQLWKEHLGLLEDQSLDKVTRDMLPLPTPGGSRSIEKDDIVADPLDDELLGLWNQTAAINTEAFRNVFHCVPDDTVSNWNDYHNFYPDPTKTEIGHVFDPSMPVSTIRSELSRIRGHLVEFPLRFLENVDLDAESVPFVSRATQDLYT